MRTELSKNNVFKNKKKVFKKEIENVQAAGYNRMQQYLKPNFACFNKLYTANVNRQTTDELMFKSVIFTQK